MRSFAVEVRSLAKYFGQVAAIENVNFKVESGSITALLGGNGAGKTTTISILMGLLTPSKGEVYILEKDMTKDRYNILPDINFSSPYVEFHIKCSKGTYIRSIANDYGEKLNSGSYLFELRRVNIGDYSVLNALKIE